MFSMLWWSILLAFCVSNHRASSDQSECRTKTFRANDSFTCVCNADYCDRFEEIHTTPPGVVTIFRSTKHHDRFKTFTAKFSPLEGSTSSPVDQIVILDRNVTHQVLQGFGGAVTDATGINIFKLSWNVSANIVQDYYSRHGLRYTLLRVPIGGSDFSSHAYSYDDAEEDDLQLQHFKLAPEDFKYKIPIIHMAQQMSKEYVQDLKLFASPWSPPAWMKTNKHLNGKGELKGEPDGVYYRAWADYLVRFLNDYKQNNISFWGMTIQNEPLDGTLDNFKFNCLGMSAEQQRDFIIKTLGPKLNASGYGPSKLALMIMDDQRPLMTKWTDTILGNPEAAKYVAGVAFHWYINSFSSPDVLEQAHRKYPNYFLLSTEACEGSGPFDEEKVSLGNWQRAENYAHDIITDLQYFTAGWVDWNLALDMEGGPNWVSNFVDAPIIVNEKAQEYYKQPMYYALAHFTRFLVPGSIRIETKSEMDSSVEVVAFKIVKDNSVVLIALNRFESDIRVRFEDAKHGQVDVTILGHSIHTLVWFD